jgi:hypothetical protein
LRGSVGEVGVHEGLSFLAAALSSDESERLFACDVFERQELNVDGSGRGDLAVFGANLGKCGLSVGDVALFAGSSTSVPRDYFSARGLPAFRFFSIDGGHTQAVTLSDLRLAASVLMQGGVVALDDIKNEGWLGVRAALFEALAGGFELAPFAANFKVFMTTPSHHALMLNFTRAALARAGIGGDLVELEAAGGPFRWPVLHIKTEFEAPLDFFEAVIREAWSA